MRSLFFLLAILGVQCSVLSQQPYQFKEIINLETTPVISQGNTGTCWSFSSTSFLESEIIRLTGTPIDLSEMYTVRNTYPVKAQNFVMRDGKAQFAEGGLAHDVINSIRINGLVPQETYNGLYDNAENHNHAELVAVLTSMLNTVVENPGERRSVHWKQAVEGVLDAYLGKNPTSFTYEGKSYTPQSFMAMTKVNPNDYLTLTSFSHAPFYSSFILNIMDNWSNGSMYNVPLDDLISVLNQALENGYTVELDCDVSERTFSSKDGVAVVPANTENNIKALQGVYPEMNIDQNYRQQEFESGATSDDHLMHITGMLKDQNGTIYYKVKNSWGTDPARNANGGYVYFSESYMRLKAISIMIHKDALPKATAKKLNI